MTHSSQVHRQRFFSIAPHGDQVAVKQVGIQDFYKGNGIYRSAVFSHDLPEVSHGTIYQDRDAGMNVSRVTDSEGRRLKVRRLYQIYDREIPLFPADKRSSFIRDMEVYPTFLTESALIDRDYIQSLFFTQKVNREGYYQYFVRRNGQYFVETIDDQIPVDGHRQMPLWGLDIQYPWQIILLKAWIKEKGSLEQVIRAEPFEFLHAFGLPAYKVANFKKEIAFIETERINEDERRKKLEDIRLNRDDLLIIAKSRDSGKLPELGLPRNRAAFIITPVQREGRIATLFRVTSTVPHKWVGQMSVIADNGVNKIFNPRKYELSLEKSFLIKRGDLLELFNKFYIAPAGSYFISQSIFFTMPLNNVRSNQIEMIIHSEGKAEIIVELPQYVRREMEMGKVRYPRIKYFLAKERDHHAPKRSMMRSRAELKSRLNLEQQEYVETEKDKYDYYDIQYGLGYHKSINQFIFLEKGKYIIHVKVEKTPKPINYLVAVHTTAKIQPLRIADMTQPEKNCLFSSVFYDLGQTHGVEVAISDRKYLESIKIGNLFYEIGYGFIMITTMKEANHHLAMRIFPRKLRQAGYALKCGLNNYKGREEDDRGLQKPIVYVSQRGTPEIIVFRMIRPVPFGQRFPPRDCVEFYRVTE